MEKTPTEIEVISSPSTETLWENFEQTGSVKAYLRYCQEVKNREKLELLDLPS
jgi:hypothetical protein